jgi:hypothetical protein
LTALGAMPAAAASVFDGRLAGGVPALTIERDATRAGMGVAAGIVAPDMQTGDRPGLAGGPVYSPLKEGAASFALPGLGQLRMGRTIRSKIYFTLEGAAWVAIGSFLWQGYAREQAYRDYAMAFADVDGTSHSDDYYETIGKFISNEGPGGYNEYVRREARDLYYPDIDAMNAYFESNSIMGAESWRWESEQAYRRYNHLRDGSRSSYRTALYAGFFALALRIVSSVDAVRLARGSGSERRDDTGSISMKLGHQRGGFRVSIKKSF